MKKYNLGNKNDMKKFGKELNRLTEAAAIKAMKNRTFKIECPNCEASVYVKIGRNICSSCGQEINFQLDNR